MHTLIFTVPPEYDGIRLKSFLRGHCHISYRLMVHQKHVPGGITCNGRLIRTIDPVHTGDIIALALAPDAHPATPEEAPPLHVLYEDDHLLVLNKPPGLAMHPSPSFAGGTLANAVAAHLVRQGQEAAFRPVGRLDRDTSGLVVAAKHAYAAARLNGCIQKEYLAVACGSLPGSGTIDAPIRRREGSIIAREAGAGGLHAVTHWCARAHGGGMTLLQVAPQTGRTHQIRVHCAHSGHPLVGDTLYGSESPLIARQALHCHQMRLTHPVTGDSFFLSVPPPPDFAPLLREMLREARS